VNELDGVRVAVGVAEVEDVTVLEAVVLSVGVSELEELLFDLMMSILTQSHFAIGSQ